MREIQHPSDKVTREPIDNKPQGPNSLQRSLYHLGGGSKPEYVNSAMDEQQAGFELTSAKSATLDGPNSMYRSGGDNSHLGERKGGASSTVDGATRKVYRVAGRYPSSEATAAVSSMDTWNNKARGDSYKKKYGVK